MVLVKDNSSRLKKQKV